jgi:Trypsin
MKTPPSTDVPTLPMRLLAARTLAFAVLAVAAAACSAAPPDAEPIAQTENGIISGKASDASQDSVVLIVYPIASGAYECTGSLLAPNLVLTARHCVSNTADQPFVCGQDGVGTAGGATKSDFTPSNMYIVRGATRPINPTAKGSFAALGSKIIHDGATNLCNHDIALLVLDRAIPGATILPVRVDSSPQAGETFTAIGWGITTTTSEPATRQQRGGVAVLDMGPTTDRSTGIGVPSREFLVGEASCQGDSGGPAVSESTGAILGVVSRGGNGTTQNPSDPSSVCKGAFNTYSAASGYKDLFVQAYAAAGQDPWWEGGPDPRLAKFGEACTGNDACRSNECLMDKGTFTTCTQECDPKTPCPTGYSCHADNTGVGFCAVPTAASTTTSKSCGCGIANVGAPAGAGWCFAGGALAIAARRRRRCSPAR